MRVVVYEQQHSGHFYRFLHYLLPALAALDVEVTVAITEAGRRSQEFAEYLTGFDSVTYVPVLSEADPRDRVADRPRLYRELRRVTRDLRPDYVLIPSADSVSWAMSVASAIGTGGLARRIPSEIGIHFGRGSVQGSIAGRVKDAVRRLVYRVCDTEHIHFVNTLFYEHLAIRAPHLRGRISPMPDPIPCITRLSTSESRRRLGIPEGGRYVGILGSIDLRKAIGPTLAAFDDVRRHDDHLLIAGRVAAAHHGTIDRHYRHLAESGALIVIDEFLERQRFEWALTACDVVCTPYPQFPHLSEMLLYGLAAGRPVLADAFGWSAAMLHRFGAGWTCNVLDPRAFASTLRLALDQSASHRQTEGVSRLLRFHSPENFAASWTARLRQRLGIDSPPQRYSWDWVLEGVPSARRHLRANHQANEPIGQGSL